MKLQKNLQRLIKSNDLTVAQLSRRSTVSRTTLADWLAGGNPRKLGQVKQVADVFALTVDELCFGEGEIRPEPIERHLEEIHAGVFEVILRRTKK